MTRPTFGRFRLGFQLDLATIRRLPRIARAFRGGDDHLLAGITRLIEEEGFASSVRTSGAESLSMARSARARRAK
jgi:hypothetical protein